MERYPLQEAEERELSLKSRLQRQDDSVPSLVIILERVISNKKVFSIFSFSVFFSPIFHSITISEGKVGEIPGRLSLFPFQSHCLSAWIDALPVHLWPAALNAWSAWNTDDFHRVVLWLGSVEKCRRCYWLILVNIGSYWFYICLEDIQSLNESFLLVAGTSTTYNLSFWIHEAPKNGTKSDPSVGIHRSGCSTPRVGVV